MELDGNLKALQACVQNSLDAAMIVDRRLAAVIGDAPSQYSKSPALWNAAFRHLGIEAIYVPLDVPNDRLGDLALAVRNCPAMLGFNVTVPHKQRIIDHLDELDNGATQIQAVNTVVRTNTGRLIGYNTDGAGFLDSILQPQPGAARSFIYTLKDTNVLILGAGGSARAVGFQIAEHLGGGDLIICNRTTQNANSLAAEIRRLNVNARAITENELPLMVPRVQLIINSTTKGQGGMRQSTGGGITTLEPYSSLAPADPIAIAASGQNPAKTAKSWADLNRSNINLNNEASLALARSIPHNTVMYDLVYHPEETVFLRHARETGHATMNGKAMIVNQAAIAFCKRICSAELQARGIENPKTHKQVIDVMYAAW